MKSGGGAGKARTAFAFLAAAVLASASCRAGPAGTASATARRDYSARPAGVWNACVAAFAEADLRIASGWITGRGGELVAGSEDSEVTVRLAAREDGGTTVWMSFDPTHAARAAALLERIAWSLRGDALLKAEPPGAPDAEVGAAGARRPSGFRCATSRRFA